MKKIMFNDRYGLTQAVIEGRKTMTRRLVPWSLTEQWIEFVSDAPSVGGVYVHESEKDFYERETPRYKVGEIVAVAQSYEQIGENPQHYIYRPDIDGYQIISKHKGWRNKMYVRAELMPHQIRITSVRCERLQDITDEDYMKEGIVKVLDAFGNPSGYYTALEGTTKPALRMYANTPREAFASLIDKISGRGTWESNPWVVVYEFELVK